MVECELPEILSFNDIIKEISPLGRKVLPEEFAEAVGFLGSPEPNSVHGIDLVVDRRTFDENRGNLRARGLSAVMQLSFDAGRLEM